LFVFQETIRVCEKPNYEGKTSNRTIDTIWIRPSLSSVYKKWGEALALLHGDVPGGGSPQHVIESHSAEMVNALIPGHGGWICPYGG
jgi:hypothetical protein